ASEATVTQSTTWSESYAVAEVKFFRHMAGQAPNTTFHLKCLQICNLLLMGTGFSTYTFKTAVMHLLTIIQQSGQRKSDYVLLLMDVMYYLWRCLQEKRLHHFFFGNDSVPEEIVLPSGFQESEPVNLFKHLALDPDAHARMMRDFLVIRDRLKRMLIYGY
ncbi:IPIL1 protein, partial [Centropus bengalensis]|nr:IPIL1 protein [Centropus bengalensis]